MQPKILFYPLSPTLFCCCSVAQLCLTLCDPMDCSMPGFPVHHQLPELAQTDVHWVGKAIQSSQPLSSPSPPCLQSFPASGSFPMSWLFVSGGLSIGASASASVLPMNIQDWFPLGLTGLISLQSKGLSNMEQVSSPIQALILLWHMIIASFSLFFWRFLCCESGNLSSTTSCSSSGHLV